MTTHTGSITTPLPRRRRAGGLQPRRVAVLLVLLAVAAIAGYVLYRHFWGAGGQPTAAYSVSSVTRQTVSSTVSVSGTVNADRQVKLSFAVDGRVSTLSVKQGDTVQAGQVLATLDPTDLQLKRDTVQSQLTAAQAQLQNLLAGTKPADLAAQQQSVASAQAALANAQNTLNNLLMGNTAEDIAAARATLDSAKAALDVAQANYDKLANGQDLTLRSEYSALQSAKADYQTALTNYNSKVNPNPADVAAAQAAVTSARSGLESAQAKLTALQNPSAGDIAAAQAAVSSAQAQLDTAKAKDASIAIGGTLAERQAAQVAVDAAQASLDAALQKRSALGGSSSAADFAAADAAVAQAQAALLTAKNNLANLQGQESGADVSAAEQAVRAAESTLATAQTNLANLLSPPAADLAAAQQGVASAQATLNTAQSTLDKLTHPSADDVAQVQSALDRARAALDTAQTNWDRLVAGTNLSTSTEATALKAAQASYQNALATYTTKTTAPKAGDVQAAQANVNSAATALTAAQAKLAQLLAGTDETQVVQQQEAVRQLELALQSAQTDLDNITLTAPFAGTVVAVGVSAGDRAAALTSVLTLLDPNLMRVDAALDESSVAKVKAGQQATITFEAIANKTFTGQVAVVTPLGTSSSGVVTYPVTLTFDPQGVTIPAGSTATAKIVVATRANALTVPSRAITHSGTTTTVNVVKDNGTLESRTVQAGITGDNNTVEIVSGLSEGEKVAISTTTQTTTSTSGTFGTGGLTGPTGGPPAGGPR